MFRPHKNKYSMPWWCCGDRSLTALIAASRACDLPEGVSTNSSYSFINCRHFHENGYLEELRETCILRYSLYGLLRLDCEYPQAPCKQRRPKIKVLSSPEVVIPPELAEYLYVSLQLPFCVLLSNLEDHYSGRMCLGPDSTLVSAEYRSDALRAD
jgi:hypothetical protein